MRDMAEKLLSVYVNWTKPEFVSRVMLEYEMEEQMAELCYEIFKLGQEGNLEEGGY